MFKTVILGREFQFETKPGLFSKNEMDLGSKFLLENVEVGRNDTIVDLGCGYGAIGLVVAKIAIQGKVYMVDVDIRAIKYSKINAELNGVKNVEVIASDGWENVPKANFDLVISNPPSHVANETIIDFIEGAKMFLKSRGGIYFVTEKRIKPMIKREFERVFGNYQMIAQNGSYIVSQAKN